MNIQFITSDLEALKRVLAAGCRWVHFVPKAETAKETLEEAVCLCREKEAVLIVDEDAVLCEAVKADGIHLSDPAQTGAVRRQLGEEPLIGVTCRNFDEAKTARAGGADYLDAGAYEETSAEALRELVRALYEADFPLPLSVSGMVTPDDIPTISATGVRGIATSDEAFFKKDVWSLMDKLS